MVRVVVRKKEVRSHRRKLWNDREECRRESGRERVREGGICKRTATFRWGFSRMGRIEWAYVR